MEKLSTDFKKSKDAIEALSGIDSEEDINIFITGEERKEILKAAADRTKELSALSSQLSAKKQGEVKDPITQPTSDFKEGVQKTKAYVTGEDVIEKLRKAGKKI